MSYDPDAAPNRDKVKKAMAAKDAGAKPPERPTKRARGAN